MLEILKNDEHDKIERSIPASLQEVDPYVAESLGTTIVAFKYKTGVVLASDSKSSSNRVIANRFARKVTQLQENIFVCRSGTSSHSQFILRLLKRYTDAYRIEQASNGTDLSEVPVKVAASLANLIIYNNRGALNSAMIIAGVDKVRGPQVFNVREHAIELDVALGGSGSVYVRGCMDQMYKKDMSKEEAKALAQIVVARAISRDVSSGGIIRMMTLDVYDGAEEYVIVPEQVYKSVDYLHAF